MKSIRKVYQYKTFMVVTVLSENSIKIKIRNMKKVFVLGILMLLLNNLFAQRTNLTIQTGHQNRVKYLSVSPDESKVFTTDINSFGILWDINSGKKLSVVKEARDGQFDASSNLLSVVYENGSFNSNDFKKNILTVPSFEHMNFLKDMSFPIQVQYDYESGSIFYGTKVSNIKTFTVTQMEPGDDAPKTSFDAIAYAPLKRQAAWARHTYGKK